MLRNKIPLLRKVEEKPDKARYVPTYIAKVVYVEEMPGKRLAKGKSATNILYSISSEIICGSVASTLTIFAVSVATW